MDGNQLLWAADVVRGSNEKGHGLGVVLAVAL